MERAEGMEDRAELQLSPLQLNKYFIKELHYAVKDNFDDKYDPSAEFPYPHLTAWIKHAQEEQSQRDWRFELTLESEDSQSTEFPYSLKIVLVGYFTVMDEYPSAQVDMLAHVNGPSLLYSAAREALVTITGRSGYPAIVLPSVMFIQHALAMSGVTQATPSAVEAVSSSKSSSKRSSRIKSPHKIVKNRSKK
jgi:preprotein translocase subunit SecB